MTMDRMDRDELDAAVKRAANYLSWIPTTDELASVVDSFDSAQKEMKAAKTALDRIMVNHIAEHGDLQVGESVWVLGKTKRTKCRDVRNTAEALLEATGGDFETVCTAMTTQPWKPASVAALIGDGSWAQLFSVTYSSDVHLQKRKPK